MTNHLRESTPVMSRRSMLRYAGLLGVAAGIGTTLSACGGPKSTNATGEQKSTITAVIGYGNNQSWDPTQTASAFSMAAILHSYEALVEGDPISREPYAALAKALPADVSGTSLKFELRDGAKWHDGKPVTADDVVFTYQRVLDPKENVAIRAYFSLWLQEVKKAGDNAVEFVLKFPFPYVLERIQIAKIMPKHVFDGKWDDATAGKVVGSGPYKVTEQAPLSHTSFEKFADYNGPRPAVFETMLWKSIVEAPARVATISGATPQAQIAENIPAENVAALTKAGRTVEQAEGMNMLWMLFNTAKAPFDDKLVRQALHYAIDSDKMVKIGLKGAGTPATSFINPALAASQPAALDFGYDPDKAKALLKQAGVSNLKVTLNTSNTTVVASCVNVIKEGWDAIGVNTTLDAADTKALFSKLDGGADFQVVVSTGNPQQFGVDPDLLVRAFYGRESLWSKTYARWTSKDAEAFYALQDTAAKEPDETKRTALVKKLMDELSTQAVFYPIVFTKMGTAWDPKKISGVKAQGYPGINLLQVKTV